MYIRADCLCSWILLQLACYYMYVHICVLVYGSGALMYMYLCFVICIKIELGNRYMYCTPCIRDWKSYENVEVSFTKAGVLQAQ